MLMELTENILTTVPLSFHIFMGLATFTVLGACGVAFSQNIVYSAFSLLATFAGMVGLFGFLSNDFLAIVQLMVYVGGILVVILFAVMLTNKISDIQSSNPSNNIIAGFTLMLMLLTVLVTSVFSYDWKTRDPGPYEPTAAKIGDAFLGPYLINFEIAGLMLLVALLAAVVVARKEVKFAEDNQAEDEG